MHRLLVFAALLFALAARAVVAETALAQSCVQRPAGLVSWWPGEGSAEDFIGPNDGILGPTTSFSQGVVGSAFDINEDGDITTVPNSPSLDFPAGSSFTIELWAFRNSSAWPQHLVGKRGLCTGLDPTYQVAIGLSAFPPDSVLVGEWSHLAVEWDGATNEVRHYVNGALVFTDTRGVAVTNDDPLTIGNSGTGCARFDGRIDEVSLYNRMLSQAEIQGIVAAGSFGKCTTDPPACGDGVDNDGDNRIDYPVDPGCFAKSSLTESPKCQDGLDNDNAAGIDFDGGDSLDIDPRDGFIDAEFNAATPEVGEADANCFTPFRNSELPNRCGLGAELALVMPLLGLAASRRRRAK